MYQYNAIVERIVDGDTLDLLIDLGFRTFVKQRVRLYGINTPETFGVKKGSAEYEAGKAATRFVYSWLDGEGSEVSIQSHDGKPLGQGKYGRWLVEVLLPNDPVSLNDALVEAGHAEWVEY